MIKPCGKNPACATILLVYSLHLKIRFLFQNGSSLKSPRWGIVKKFVLAYNLKGGYRVLTCLPRSFTTLLVVIFMGGIRINERASRNI
jgi:hypothetical protein